MAQPGVVAYTTSYFIFLLLIATIGPLLFGYHLAELNAPSEVLTCAKELIPPSALPGLFKDTFHTLGAPVSASALPQCIPMSATQFGLVSSFFTLGGLIGALAAGPVSARTGRIRSMLYAGMLAMLGPIVEAFAPSVTTMAVGRAVAGLGAGTAMVVVPIYIFDIAPPGNKGFFGSFTQVMVNVGILVTQVLGYFLSRGQLWRIVLGIGGAIAALQVAGLLLAGQESPKWMADHGKVTSAKKVLRKIRGHNADIDAEIESWGAFPNDIEEEEVTLLTDESSSEDRAHKPKLDPSQPPSTLQVLAEPTTRPALIAITTIMLAQQFTGINSIIMYGVSLLSDLLSANSALLNIAVSALNVIVTASAAPLVDKFGRKTCLLLSIAGMGVNSVLLAIGIEQHISLLSAIAVALFVCSFSLGLGPIPFILPSELVDAHAVGAVQSWGLAVNWIATFVVAQFFPVLNESLPKGRVYFVFAAMSLFFCGFIGWYVPESKGKRDADEVWGRIKTDGRED